MEISIREGWRHQWCFSGLLEFILVRRCDHDAVLRKIPDSEYLLIFGRSSAMSVSPNYRLSLLCVSG